MTDDEKRGFIDTIRKIQESNSPLSKYFDREIADALQSLINFEVAREREKCALVAESVAEPAGTLTKGQAIEVDEGKRSICLEIAKTIRDQR